jgi:FkbM family methyltransferase
MKLNDVEVRRWFGDKGDYTHNIDYDLNEDSVIMDLGGYTGVWAKQIITKYNPNIYIIEPITKFYDGMVKTFESNDKVNLLNVGAGSEDKDGIIYLSGDGTSSNLKGGESVNVKFNTMETILDKWGIDSVDLIQINIEGDEYPLLEGMLKSGVINKFKNIQIQFHYGIEGDVERRVEIQKGLKDNGYEIKFNYPFVWESWYKK